MGALFLGVSDTTEKALLNYLKSKKILDTGYFFVLDSKGKMVLHPTKTGQDVSDATDVDGRKIFKEILANKNGSLEYRWLNAETHQVQNKLAIFETFPDVDWVVAASVNMAEVDASKNQLRTILLSVSILMTIFSAIAAMLFGTRVSNKLTVVSRSLKDGAQKLDRNSRALGDEARSLAESSTRQAASLQQTTSALEEINAMISRNAESAKFAEGVSRSVSQKADDGKTLLGNVETAMSLISQKNEEFEQASAEGRSDFQKLAGIISSIEEKTKIINEIVFQTKLLSFNASVEAARAGEHGKGFAVVAEEVGNLASMSGSAAKEIESSLLLANKQVTETVDNANKRTDRLLRGMTEQTKRGTDSVSTCQSAFQDIVDEIERAHSAIHEIAEASAEQARGIAEINSAASQLDQVTQQNSQSSQHVSSMSIEIKSNSGGLENAVSSLVAFVEGVQVKRAS